jgi:uncharacterized membrane protein
MLFFSEEGLTTSDMALWRNITLLIILSLMLFYVLNVYRNNRVEKRNKNLWAALLVLGNIMVYPVYWYLYIWHQPKKEAIIQDCNDYIKRRINEQDDKRN